MRRLHGGVALALLAGLLIACGDDADDKGPVGSESNPVQALPNPSNTRTPPDVAGERTASNSAQDASTQGSEPQTLAPKPATSGGSERKQKAVAPSASRPCSLVPKAQAQVILGTAIREPLHAPQGPTCIYQASSGKQFATLTVQRVRFSEIRRQVRKRTRVVVSKRSGFCGSVGRTTLYLPLSKNGVLTVTAPCPVAKKFAAQALRRL